MTNTLTTGSVLWLLLVGFGMLMYLALDGFDLGIGVLTLLERDPQARKTMIRVVGTAWDGNESWLIFVGVGLYGGFPLAYSTLLPAFYVPILLMLFALIARGASIEFQAQAQAYLPGWGGAFQLGSLVAILSQGMILGALTQGVPVANGHFVGSPFWWVSPASVLTGLSLVCLDIVLGAGWLSARTRGTVQQLSQAQGQRLSILASMLLLVTMVVISLHGAIALTDWHPLAVIGLTLGALALLIAAAQVFARENTLRAFLLGAGALVLGVFAMLSTIFPYLVPAAYTFWQAASPSGSLNFLIIGVGACIPMILIYNGFAYWVFRAPLASPPSPSAGA